MSHTGGKPPKVATASPEAAATAAATTVLIKMLPESMTAKVSEARDAYLAGVPNGDAKDRGIKLGEETAAKAIELRASDGNNTVNAFRPITRPGVYTETMVTFGYEYATMPARSACHGRPRMRASG